MFKFIRVFILVIILLIVAKTAWHEKIHTSEWRHTLSVNVYPVNGDGSDVTASYIQSLKLEDFSEIETFMEREALAFGRSVSTTPIKILLHSTVDSLPPNLPENKNIFATLWWSLKMRWWTFQNAPTSGSDVQIKLFLLYYDPATHSQLSHSTALQKGLIGRINVFADHKLNRKNAVIITHEFLHTLGATDKYDLSTNQPIFPDGYANVNLAPLLPQKFAEIMAGRIPHSEKEAEIPDTLDSVVIGNKTAQEINWINKE